MINALIGAPYFMTAVFDALARGIYAQAVINQGPTEIHAGDYYALTGGPITVAG